MLKDKAMLETPGYRGARTAWLEIMLHFLVRAVAASSVANIREVHDLSKAEVKSFKLTYCGILNSRHEDNWI